MIIFDIKDLKKQIIETEVHLNQLKARLYDASNMTKLYKKIEAHNIKTVHKIKKKGAKDVKTR